MEMWLGEYFQKAWHHNCETNFKMHEKPLKKIFQSNVSVICE